MFYDFIVAFCGQPPALSFSTLPQCFAFCMACLVLVISLSVVIRGIYSICSVGFRNKI